jgi:hypothetical protein
VRRQIHDGVMPPHGLLHLSRIEQIHRDRNRARPLERFYPNPS